MMRIAINGFGRIGRTFLRTLLLDSQSASKIEVAVINVGPAVIAYAAHMFKYDTLMGTFSGNVLVEGDQLVVNGTAIKLIAITDDALLSWKQYHIEWVVDCSGNYTNQSDAQKHISRGAQKVLISAPGHGVDSSIIMGINDHLYDAKKHNTVSLGSCTTNAFIPLLSVLDTTYQVEGGFMTTVHAYTNTQVLLDVEAKDLRCSRAAALNIIPTTTGASSMLGLIMPHLKDKIVATAIRVPVGKVSLVDLAVTVKKDVTVDGVNALFQEMADKKLKAIISVSFDPLVSCDFAGDSHSAIVDAMMTQVVGNMVHVYAWYDNEWAYSMRMKDFLMKKSG